jgi:hypothetical protein
MLRFPAAVVPITGVERPLRIQPQSNLPIGYLAPGPV